MTNTLVAQEHETFPNRKRWTRQQCQRLVETGELVGRYELIDGEILSKTGQNPPHRITLILLVNWLLTLFDSLYVQVQNPIALPGEEGETTEPEPDVAVTVAPTTAYMNSHPAPDDLQLVVEVSDTTLRFDLTTKALLYARVGIREYWVMDIAQRSIHIHRLPTPDGYAQVSIHTAEEMVALAARPEDTVRVSALFPPVEGEVA
jgi:Uma2 family endonuclease